MFTPPLSIATFPRAVLHIDGDAFFASCEQSLDPTLKGTPVITGKERGIAASMSYEAKARGVTRGMRLFEIKKTCPDAILLPSDYETYSLLSKRFYDIVRRYTSEVEGYGIDECFADITGMRRPLRMSYAQIAETLQHDLESELGFTFSIGLGPNKSIAKIASKWTKPAGLTVIPAKYMHHYLAKTPVEKIWGIGPQTTAFLAKFGVTTALQFARKNEAWITKNFSKPLHEIWQELNGRCVFPIVIEEKDHHHSIQKFKTFTPPSSNRAFVFAQLSKNIENACIKARRYYQAAREVIFILRRQDFTHAGVVVTLARPGAVPGEIIQVLEEVFDELFDSSLLYRQTGVILIKLVENQVTQLDLFGEVARARKFLKAYEKIDELSARYGKHSVFLGSSFYAHKFSQHLGDRGDLPKRKLDLFKGETRRKRLGIPMFTGKVL